MNAIEITDSQGAVRSQLRVVISAKNFHKFNYRFYSVKDRVAMSSIKKGRYETELFVIISLYIAK